MRRLVVPEFIVPVLPASLLQFTTPFTFAVSLPELVKPVQSSVVRVRPPADWMPARNVDVAVSEVMLRMVASTA